MFKFLKYVFLIAFCVGGWALAASSLHVVRSTPPQGRWYLPVQIQFMTKSCPGWKDTWVDTTKWTAADLEKHPEFVKRLEQTGREALKQEFASRPAPPPSESQPAVAPPAKPQPNPQAALPAVETSKTPTTPVSTPAKPAAEKRPTSIFDFSK